MGGCATPITPTGGPPDTTPPVVEHTTPEVGTTNFDGDEVRFDFSEFPDRSSVRQNVTIEPNLGIQFEVSFSRKTAIVEFLQPLPDSTTVIVQMGADVTDTRNNSMDSSYKLAFSTGPVIDDGNVSARLRDADRGSVEAGERVYLYRAPADFTEPANYLAQSDTAGEVNFSYLSEGHYSAIWIDDINRDRRWNPERERAQPFHVKEFDVMQGEEFSLGTIYIHRPDTVSPNVDGVGLLSEERLRLRLSEQVEWTDEANFTISDSLGESYTTAYPLYVDQSDQNVVYAQALDPMSETEQFILQAEGFRDAAGNPMQVDVDPFQGSSEPDTTQLRYISDNSRDGLFPDQAVEVIYSKFIDDESVVDSLRVYEGDQEYTNWEQVEVNRNKLRIMPDGDWQAGIRYRFAIWDPEFIEHRTLEPEIWQRNELGSIEFTLANADTNQPVQLRLTDEDRRIEIDTLFTNSIEIDNLPPLSYQAKAFRDSNGNGQWDTGSIEPFRPPEPYFLRREVPVREGFTSELAIEFADMPEQRPGMMPVVPEESN